MDSKKRPRTRAKRLKKIPRFKSEAEERAFWLTHDKTDYFPAGSAGARLRNVKTTPVALWEGEAKRTSAEHDDPSED